MEPPTPVAGAAKLAPPPDAPALLSREEAAELTTKQLRQLLDVYYEDARGCGEGTKSGNRAWLVRKLAVSA